MQTISLANIIVPLILFNVVPVYGKHHRGKAIALYYINHVLPANCPAGHYLTIALKPVNKYNRYG